jgi:protocatechuate 3,4-dioxygenase beta subunit
MRRVLLAGTMSAVALAAQAQPPRGQPTQPSVPTVITGRVVAEATGDPLPNVRVALRSGVVDAAVALTDAEGHFVLTATQNRSSVDASKTGYAPSETSVTAGAVNVIRLRRGAVVTGRVVDQVGDPVPTVARVTLERRTAATGALTVVASSETDDRGEYRLASLPEGSYVVAVTTVTGPVVQVTGPDQFIARPGVQKIFFPNVPTATEADEVALRAGHERSGINFVVAARRPEADLPPQVLARQAMRPADTRAIAAGTGVIRGRVVSTEGRAIPNAMVRLMALADITQSRATRADEDGRFEFSELGAGKFDLVASKVGYSVPSNGLPGGNSPLRSRPTVDLADGEKRDRIDVVLARWSALSGRIVDEYGDPLQGASVQVMQVRYQAGRRRLVGALAAGHVTDDLGRYRLYALAPGQYVVSATIGAVSTSDVPGYARSYFPGTTIPVQAQFVSVELSQDVTGIDFPMARARTARVAGSVLTPDGEPTMGGNLTLRSSLRSASVTAEEVGARILPDGRFEFPNVAPGQYIIQANRGRVKPWLEGEFGTLPVVVDDADVTGLVLQMSAGSSVTGRFTFDTVDRSTSLSPVAFELTTTAIDADLSPTNGLAVADVHDDWTFAMAGLNGPRRLQLTSAPRGWAVKEIRLRGIDVTDRALPFGRAEQSLTDVEVIVTDRVNELTGSVTADNARPVPGSFVVVFSTDRDRWYPSSRFMRRTMAESEGAFRISGLPFGNYYVAAVTRLPSDGADAWQDPELLQSLIPIAATVTLSEGDRQVVNLRIK